MMSWSTGWVLNRRPLLWNMYDAGLTDETDAPLIGWVYGELSSLVDINEAVPDLRNLPRITKPEQREPEAIPDKCGASGRFRGGHTNSPLPLIPVRLSPELVGPIPIGTLALGTHAGPFCLM